MAISKNKIWPDQLPQVQTPIKYLTENGFSIVRISDLDPSASTSPADCAFVVERNDKSAHEIHIGFDQLLTAALRIRRQFPLPDSSMFWLVCAESFLANYLWQNDDLPPNPHITINELCPDELMLALHWRDPD